MNDNHWISLLEIEAVRRQEEVEAILTFVPEAEYLTYEESLMLALDRNQEAAYDLEWSVLNG